MTAYELLDLRRGYTSEVVRAFSFWVSITFAVLAAAHVAGPGMGIAGVFAATLLYLVITAVVAFSIKRFMRIVDTSTEDVAALVAQMEDKLATLSSVTPSGNIGNALLALQCAGFVGTTSYVLFRSGYIG